MAREDSPKQCSFLCCAWGAIFFIDLRAISPSEKALIFRTVGTFVGMLLQYCGYAVASGGKSPRKGLPSRPAKQWALAAKV